MRRLTLIAACACALTACGGDAAKPDAAKPYTAHGLTVRLPAGWRAAPQSLTPNLVDPRERLAVATFPLRYRPTQCAHLPGSALEDVGARGALVTLMERGGDRHRPFPARPVDFQAREGTTPPSEASACVPRARFVDHWFTFSDRGRDFYVLMAFGPQASAATRRQAWRILDGLRVASKG